MKIKMLKDVLISSKEVGRRGQVVELADGVAKEYIKAGHATEVAAGSPDDVTIGPNLTAALDKAAPAGVVTSETIKKPKPGPAETK
jgi:hypothetical protein